MLWPVDETPPTLSNLCIKLFPRHSVDEAIAAPHAFIQLIGEAKVENVDVVLSGDLLVVVEDQLRVVRDLTAVNQGGREAHVHDVFDRHWHLHEVWSGVEAQQSRASRHKFSHVAGVADLVVRWLLSR